MARQYWVETLGCPKNQVDSDKLVGTLVADGFEPASSPDAADLVVVNTCAFIGEARQESVDTILALDQGRKDGAELVVTGCMAERYGQELADALPEVQAVAPFGVSVTGRLGTGTGTGTGTATATTTAAGPAAPAASGTSVPVSIGVKPAATGAVAADGDPGGPVPAFDLLELPRPPASAPWAYVKVAEGCDRACGFCAIPSFRGKQRSRTVDSILAEVDGLGVREVVLVAQDLAAFGRDQGQGERRIVPLVRAVADRVDWVRLLYLYPSDLTDELIDTMCGTGVPYFDLSLQHVSAPHLRRMRRWGSGERFVERIEAIRRREPTATFRSNFIVGYPGETEDDHDQLLTFVEEVELDWCGFFAYSEEEGTYAADLEPKVPTSLRDERLRELRELQDRITTKGRIDRIGTTTTVLVDTPGQARSVSEAPEIDGIVTVDVDLAVGDFHTVTVIDAEGPDLIATGLTDRADR